MIIIVVEGRLMLIMLLVLALLIWRFAKAAGMAEIMSQETRY